MPELHSIGPASELPEGSHRVVRVGNRELGVFNIHGEYYAIPNLCPHQRGPLCEGRVNGTLHAGPETDWKLSWILDGEVITCPWHSMEFHVPTGQCLANKEIKLRTYEVQLRDGELHVVV